MTFTKPRPNRRSLVYLEWPLSRTAGGPSGYLWHLKEGLRLLGAENLIEFAAPQAEPAAAPHRARALVDSTRRIEPVWRLLKTYGPTITRRDYLDLMRTAPEDLRLPREVEAKLSVYDALHCHTTLGALRAHNSLRALGRRDQTTLFLTSHCPEMPANELTAHMLQAGLLPGKAPRLQARLTELDLHAFASADVIVFPCPEAMDPYRLTCSRFAAAIKGKDVRFVLTGICDLPETAPAPPAGVDDGGLKLVFVGRHNSIKGYDLLCEVVPPFLDAAGAWMLVAGRQGPLTAPPHPRWKEVGWTPNPGGLVRAGDLFVLANRQTYFDLVALEVMAMGSPILASATGGNKALAALSPGVILFEPTAEGLRRALDQAARLTRPELARLGRENRRAYETYFTESVFAAAFLQTLVPPQDSATIQAS